MKLHLTITGVLAAWFAFQSQFAIAQQSPANPAEPVEVYVWGQQPTSAATEQTRAARDLELRPSNTPSDVLRLTPGLVIGQHHGGGKADQILFRGFDSDHGTDFAVFIDGIPVNMVSHAHGQGYADLHWLIPETIEKVEIYKGSYFAQLGDFATSGAMNIITKRRDKDSTITLSGGSYNTQRYVGIFSPPEGTILRPYIAGEVFHNDGPFKSENNYIRYNILAKLGLISTANSNLSFLGTFFKTAWDASGEIPARSVRGGEIGRFGTFDPSEGGKSERQNLSLIYNYADANQAFNAQTWLSWYQLQLWSKLFVVFQRRRERRRHRTERQAIPGRQQRQLPEKLQSLRLADGNLGRLSEPFRSYPRRAFQPDQPAASGNGQE